VSPPTPFAQLPDSELKTGLMEVGNPAAGVIGIGFANQADVVPAGFQRGWEKAYRTPDRAFIDVNVFEFREPTGPTTLVALFQSRTPGTYTSETVPGVPDAHGAAGTSPEGRTAVAVAVAHGRFLVSIVGGGTPGAYGYEAIVQQLTRDQLARLPA
jgi:hypothetical protein